ncbi:MAG: hypothetical protein HFI08_02240 [Bacilli bacterium]|nr:hypothetical protein [Bacilli bacterium]
MNNNDTNNLGNNGMTPNSLGGTTPSTPSSFGPVNGGLEQLGGVNPVNPPINSMQGESLGNSTLNMNTPQNTPPTMITPEVPTNPAPVNQGINLLNTDVPVSPAPEPEVAMQQPQDMANMTLGSMTDNVAPIAPVNNPMMENMTPTAPVDAAFNMGSQTNPSVSMNSNMNSIPDANMNPMGMNSMNQSNSFDMLQSNNNSSPFGNTGMPQPTPMGENPFAQPNMGMNPNMNGNVFGSVPTPPVGNLDGGKKKSKLKFSKTTIILIVVLVIAIIGCGVYLILTKASQTKTKGDISTKDLVLELGKPLSTNITDYALISGFNASTCTLDTSKVNTKRMGSYEYTITCGSTSKAGSIVLQDKTAPVVAVKEVMVTPGTLVSFEDFIVSCDDYTDCSYEFEDQSQSLETLVQTVGDYNLNLVVSDDYDNKTTVSLHLIVSDDAPVRNMYCTPTPTEDDDLKASLEVSYNYGINTSDILARTEKTYFYTFDNEEDYLAVKNNYSETTGINGVIGQTVFDDEEFTITILVSMSETDLGNDFNMNPFPTDYEGLRQFHIDQGITCKNR